MVVPACASTDDVSLINRRPTIATDTAATDTAATATSAPDATVASPTSTRGPIPSRAPTRPSRPSTSTPSSSPSRPTTTRPPETTSSPSGPTGPVDPGQRDLILALWSGYGAAVAKGDAAAADYVAAQAYPDLGLTAEACAGLTEGGSATATNVTVDPASIRAEPGWVVRIPRSPMDATTPKGTIYNVAVATSYDDGTSETTTAHTTVLDGKAYFFFSCG